ncbi:hypothetical protein COU39_00490 [Candidatus Micrarchaeota archaeon CG10_big_fil_rev_8_21_14_0_10_60_32]|nr:MAG: hypothetical protein AUJ16_02255 [Candidatus Micrarchaeota archaeon CG1_02_60_51]PIN96569.1 MAG: hypothetical protein COU39_00490 [Candidatus Micrarchaeota archaeon CG10_big_fil_rev_8_21_14_0_10_60_32]PIO02206.1 MAG: hypothetical protein COT58_01365 [Candidatus Micrarchaeota archaeon CG09_land_8_20_14_0_10_60_16]PIY91575.1 MAG: hypothetical protein COY71_02440 [Candidatus Micrarchaeota archaeon CG_4_10_14_0_8_um_filter_60_7]
MGEGYIKIVSKRGLGNIHRVIQNQLADYATERPYLAEGQGEARYVELFKYVIAGQGLLRQPEENVLAELLRHAGKNGIELAYLADKAKLEQTLLDLKYEIRA